MRKLLILLVLLACGGCAVSRVHFGIPPTERQKEYYIARYWAEAQELLEDKTNGTSVVVPHDIFKWHWSKTLLRWQNEPAYGVFIVRGKQIWIFECRPWTIRHEACHAILHHLGYEDWKSYCHEGREWK